jgi:hypothetical protein
LVDIAGDISFTSQVTQERARISHAGNKINKKCGIFVINQTNCNDLAREFDKVRLKAFEGIVWKGSHAMKVSLNLGAARLVGAIAAILLCCAGSAWAGDGGPSLTSIQAIIGKADGSTGLCKILSMKPCPQVPTVTQALLEAAGLELSPIEMVAAQNQTTPGSNVNAANPAAVPVPTPFPLNSTTSPTLSGLLSTLTPLAFQSASKSGSTATATQLYASDINTFLYGVAVSTFGISEKPGGTVPDTALLFYDDVSQPYSSFPRGTTVAKFLLPLTVLNVDTLGNVSERQVATTLNFIAPTTNCSASTLTGDFMGSGTPQTIPATDIAGFGCVIVFGPSPTSSASHAIFEVEIPLLVTGTAGSPYNTDPAYFYTFNTPGAPAGPINTGLFTAFTFFDDVFGTVPAPPPFILGANGVAIGMAPTAGPLGPPPTCSGTGCTPPPSTFALCASLPQNGSGQQNGNAQGQQNGSGQALVPAVGAYYAIATDGEMLLSAALPAASTSVCPRL